jgi:hypothetical protein
MNDNIILGSCGLNSGSVIEVVDGIDFESISPEGFCSVVVARENGYLQVSGCLVRRGLQGGED